MRILVVCDQGNNRSVTLAHQLKYLGHDVLSAGLKTNSVQTLYKLGVWAQKIIYTDAAQQPDLPWIGEPVELWDIGPDVYPRPFNKELLTICRRLVAEHKEELR